MPMIEPRVQLLRHTPDPDELVALGARLCYSSATLDDLGERVGETDQRRFLDRLLDMGHLSPAEHATFTFGIEGVSRALLAQITRHRIASFSVQSQRYVAASGFDYVVPPSIRALGEEAVAEFEAHMRAMQGFYDGWIERGIAAEDARFALPNAAATRIIVTMNARELWHFFALRCCNRAQWEIRGVAWRMLALCLDAAPALFAHAGPSCVGGACPEGKKSCGQMMKMKERVAALIAGSTESVEA